jgi:hypothetical protein
MKLKITAILCLIGGIGWTLIALYLIVFENYLCQGPDEYFGLISILVPSISMILYVKWTKYGKVLTTLKSELNRIEIENNLILKQIEQKELKKRLEEG